MVITSEDVRFKLTDIWGDLKDIWLRNKKYISPTQQELQNALDKFNYSNLPVIPGFNECENFSLFLHSDIKKYGVSEDQNYNWAFGDFICKKTTTFQGVRVHSANICICQDDIYIIEPMYNNTVSIADKNKYDIFFVNMC